MKPGRLSSESRGSFLVVDALSARATSDVEAGAESPTFRLQVAQCRRSKAVTSPAGTRKKRGESLEMGFARPLVIVSWYGAV